MHLERAVSSVVSQYAVFTGRARPSEYWFWVLAGILVCLAAGTIDAASGVPIIGYAVSLAGLVPTLAVGARRLHDIGRSGWWQLIVLVPVAGVIILMVWFVTDGEAHDNRYGPNPKGVVPVV